MPRTFNEEKAREVVAAVERLKGSSSFRNLLKEMARRGIVKDNKTLRLYLNLLVAGKVLSVRMHDVGSVYPQQIYSLRSKRPIVWVGPGILRKHGLNWEIPLSDIRQISSDFDGLARSQILESGLMAALEDCLAYELHADAKENTVTTSLVIAMISTVKVDLPYLIRRADQIHVGRTMRLLFKRLLEIVSSNHTDFDGSAFLIVRNHFLRIVRQYTQTGFWNVVENETGIGSLGFSIAKSISESDVIGSAAKQMGVLG